MKPDPRFLALAAVAAAAARTAVVVLHVAANLAGRQRSFDPGVRADHAKQNAGPLRPGRFVVVSTQEADVRGYAIGDRVSQPQYGNGTVRLVDEHHTVIDFDEHGLRRFATAIVKLERSTTAEPDKPAKRTRKKAAPKQAAAKA